MVRYVRRRYVRTCGATHNIILYAVANILQLHLQVSELSSGSSCLSFPSFSAASYKQPGNRGAAGYRARARYIKVCLRRTQDWKQSSDFNAYWNTAQFQLPSVYTRIGIGPYRAGVLNYVKYVIVLIQQGQEILRKIPLSGGRM